ncbi:MAG: type I restriction enzyme endonuclease domain-containing protein, partial [Bacteroidia bacterium]
LLDTSVVPAQAAEKEEKYTIKGAVELDLSKLDFEKLREEFKEKQHKNIAFEDLRQLLQIKLKQMMAQNKTRGKFLERFQAVIDEYNNGSLDVQAAYDALIKETRGMTEEQSRAAKMGMTEAELELFDLLYKDKLTKKEEKEVKKAAQELLNKVIDAKVLVQEWYKEKATQEMVRREIKKVLDKTLPTSYDRNVFSEKADVVFQHLYESAQFMY